MPNYRHPPLTLAEVWLDGPPVRLRDLVAITTLSWSTVRRDIDALALRAHKRQHGRQPVYFVARPEARRYLSEMGFHGEQPSPLSSLSSLST